MAVHVSIHDVSPAWTEEVELALSYCQAVGARPALLVVPDFHAKWPIDRHPRFAERLRALQAGGHEIFLHGYFHKAGLSASAPGRDGKPAGIRRAFAQRVVSGGEAEMSDVSKAEAVKRLDDGAAMLRALGLTIDGYVAPAWSMPPWLLGMLAERGYAFTEDHMFVYDPARGRRRASLVLNFASRTPDRLVSSALWCRLARPIKRLFPARIAIHPGDMKSRILRHEVRDLLAWGKGDFVTKAPELFSA